MNLSITVIRSRRRTLALEIRPDCTVTVRAPLACTDEEIRRFVARKESWILSHLEKMRSETARTDPASGAPRRLSSKELKALADAAMKDLPERCAKFAPLVGVSYGRITIRNQRTRWGSCSPSGALSFNCVLVNAPPAVLDSVVVHELCHRIHPNHSAAFYAEISRVFPDYARCHEWLKENGAALIRRLPQSSR